MSTDQVVVLSQVAQGRDTPSSGQQAPPSPQQDPELQKQIETMINEGGPSD